MLTGRLYTMQKMKSEGNRRLQGDSMGEHG